MSRQPSGITSFLSFALALKEMRPERPAIEKLGRLRANWRSVVLDVNLPRPFTGVESWSGAQSGSSPLKSTDHWILGGAVREPAPWLTTKAVRLSLIAFDFEQLPSLDVQVPSPWSVKVR